MPCMWMNVSTVEIKILLALEKCEMHSATPRASLCTSLMFLKIPACLYNSTMHSGAFFISLIYLVPSNHDLQFVHVKKKKTIKQKTESIHTSIET